LATCYSKLSRFQEATSAAKEAIQLDPESDYGHWVWARVLSDRNRPDEAIEAIQEALRIDPFDADYLAFVSEQRYYLQQYQPSLQAANEGLAVDPNHTWCARLRALCLMALGRRKEAVVTMNSALEAAPEDGRVHLVQGLAQLENRRPKSAITHFLEALRIEPELEGAREGIVEALKARSWLFRWPWLVVAQFAKGEGCAIYAFGILFSCAFIVVRLLPQAPTVALDGIWMTLAVLFGLISFVWLADPLMNVCLLLHPIGRHALADDQTRAARWLSVVALLSLVPTAAWSLGFELGRFLTLALMAWITPFALTFKVPPGRNRVWMWFVTGLTAVLGLTVCARSAMYGAESERRLWVAYLLSSLASLLIAAFLRINHMRQKH
jgi:Tfp pilus assembly protein PilF